MQNWSFQSSTLGHNLSFWREKFNYQIIFSVKYLWISSNFGAKNQIFLKAKFCPNSIFGPNKNFRTVWYWRVIIFYFSIVVAKFQQERSATHQEVSPISSLTKFLGQNIWDRETAMEYPKVPPYIHTAKETQRKCCCAIRAASPTRHLNPQQQKHFFATLKSIHFRTKFSRDS